jgi:protocatechuate 3,4-dioxygenase beta subunit
MNSINRNLSEPWWQPSRIDITRRRALLGLSAMVMAAASSTHILGQQARSCVLTPDAGEGPFYLDPKLVRSDIVSGQPGAPLQLALQVIRAGDCATLPNALVDVWHADALGLYSGYENQSGVGGVSTKSAAAQQYLRGTQFTSTAGNVQFRTIFPSWYGGRTPHVQDRRQAGVARQLQLRDVEALLLVAVEPGHEPIEPDLAHRHQAFIARLTRQRIAQHIEVLVRRLADAQGVDAQRISQPVLVREFAHALEVRRLHRRQHADRHTSRARALPHRIAVGVELGGIKVTVGVDPRHRVDPRILTAGVHVPEVAAYHRSRQRRQTQGAA